MQLDQHVDVHSLRPCFVEQGVWIRPFKDIVYLMPSFIMSRNELNTLTEAVLAIVSAIQ